MANYHPPAPPDLWPPLAKASGMSEAGQPPDSGGTNGALGKTSPPGGSGQTGVRSYASVSKAAPCNRFPTIHLAPRQYGNKDGKPSVSFSPAELQAGVEYLKYTLVAKFSTGRPHIEEIRQTFMSTWGLGGKCSIGALDARHVLIVLDSEQEARKVLAHPARKLGHAFFRVFRWTEDFDTKKEPSVTTSWIRLMNLPPGMFNQGYIATIVASFSRFIAVDIKTATLNNPCYARVCVEIDTTKSLPDAVWINTGGEGGFWQRIVYESRLLFCTRCKLHGHSLENCRKALRRRVEEQQIWAVRDEHGLPTIRAVEKVAAGIGDRVQASTEIGRSILPQDDNDRAWTLVQKKKGRTPFPAKSMSKVTTKKEKLGLDRAEANRRKDTPAGPITCPADPITSSLNPKAPFPIKIAPEVTKEDNPLGTRDVIKAAPEMTKEVTFREEPEIVLGCPQESEDERHVLTVHEEGNSSSNGPQIKAHDPDGTSHIRSKSMGEIEKMVLSQPNHTDDIQLRQMDMDNSCEDNMVDRSSASNASTEKDKVGMHSSNLHISKETAQKLSTYSDRIYDKKFDRTVGSRDLFMHFLEKGVNETYIFRILDDLVAREEHFQQESSVIPFEESELHDVQVEGVPSNPMEEFGKGNEDRDTLHNSDKESYEQVEFVAPSHIPSLSAHQKTRQKKKKGSRSSNRLCPKKKEVDFVYP